VASGTFLEHVCPAVGCPGETREGQILVGAGVPSVREEAGCFLRVIQQSKVVGCCPDVQALIIRRCFVVTPVDVLTVEVANKQEGCGNVGMAVGVNREREGL